MKYADEFRDPAKARALIDAINVTLERVPMPDDRPWFATDGAGVH